MRLPSGDSAILLVRHADVAAAVLDPRLSRNHVLPQAPRNSAEPNFLYDPDLMINQETATHSLIHRITTQTLSAPRVATYRPLIERVATELADRMGDRGPVVDLVESFTDWFPLRTIGALLGVPPDAYGDIRRWSGAYTMSQHVEADERAVLNDEFDAFVRDLTADPSRTRPGAPLLRDLADSTVEGARLSDADLMSIVKLLLSAGSEAPAAVLGRSVLYLLTAGAERWARLPNDEDGMGAVVEELLRLVYAGNAAALRTALADIELPSGTVPAGQPVLLAWISALHDPEVYEAPQQFRPGRPAPRNIGFGGGRHYCPGVSMAKTVLTVALLTLADRFPGLRLAVPETEVPLAEREIGTLVQSLPVTLAG
ncbi:cytochrome P450 [Streptomyces sp. NPDC088354]|uniref:cytochrome P450 n=1 Tax=Streptomyces sp. NPDC088354 TaxID=3365856 RepID=UPI0037F22CEE